MTCDPWREALSARADGEAPTIDVRLLDAHVATCASCREFAANVHEVRRGAFDVARPARDLSGSVVAAARAADRRSVWWVLRLGLGVVAVQVLVLSAPALLLGHSHGSDEHAARHLGSFSIAYAIGLLVVSLRPAKARGMLPLAGALAGCLAITAVIDVSSGHAPAITEFQHIPEVVGLVLVWLLAMPKRLPQAPSSARLPRLSSVRNDASAHRDSVRRQERRSS
jgi:predicted anti-sigma-YlaC factor YlaD